jgi:polar amino acid transport system substrate-binding protein
MSAESDPPRKERGQMRGGWYNWDPYQYLKTPGDESSLTGLDVELEKLIMKKAGFSNVTITPVSWKQHQEELKTGDKDFAMGAFYSKERAKLFYLTVPYRYEENSLFILRKDEAKHTYTDVKSFLGYVKKNNLKIGVIDGYRYASDEINSFIESPDNKDNIIRSATDNDNLNLLLNTKIQGFLADRIVGATIIWREKVGRQVSEKRLGVKAPIYMLLSKKTVSETELAEINKAILDLKNSPDYVRIVAWYLYPILLLETTDSDWFVLIEIIGIIAFALSGLVVGYRCGASLFGTFLLCLLPSFGGGVLRDVIFGRFPVWFMLAKHYLILVICISVIGFELVRIYRKFGHHFTKFFPQTKKIHATKVFDVLLTITDAAGLAAFTVTGVLVSLIVKTDPLWLWGPFFAFLTGAGGGMMRDLFVRDQKITAINGGLYGEIAIFWGLILSLYLTYTAHDVDPFQLEIAVILVIVLEFISRLLIYYFNVPNIYIDPKRKVE